MQRMLAAKHLVRNLLQKSPLVQAVQQRSLTPYKAPLSKALSPANLTPVGRVRTLKPLNPKLIRQGWLAIERESAAMKNADRQAAFKRVMANRKVEEMKRAWSGFLNRQF